MVAGGRRCHSQRKRMEVADPWQGMEVPGWWHGMEVADPWQGMEMPGWWHGMEVADPWQGLEVVDRKSVV